MDSDFHDGIFVSRFFIKPSNVNKDNSALTKNRINLFPQEDIIVEKFDPQILESRLTKKSMIESVVPATRKAKLWERFSELYAEISREAEDDFEAFFGREFVKAYESQINQLDMKKNRS